MGCYHLDGRSHSIGQSPSLMAGAQFLSLLHIGMTWTFEIMWPVAGCTITHTPNQVPKGMKHFCKNFLIDLTPTLGVTLVVLNLIG